MEQQGLADRSREGLDFNLQDDFFKSCITKENTKSRRFSASNLTSFREEARSFRHAPSISSTASSPGYSSRDHIDPSTYSFSAALQALQGRSGWESLPSMKSISNGNPLHSKWNEAERYICNPLSGQVPMECLSARTLSGRSLATWKNTTKSAPLFFSHSRDFKSRPMTPHEEEPQITELDKYTRHGNHRNLRTRDVGTQSTPPDLSSSSSSPDSTPPIKEISLISCGLEGAKLRFDEEAQHKENEQVEGKARKKLQRKKEVKEREMFKCKLGRCLAWGLPTRKQQRGRVEETIQKWQP